MAKPSRRFLSQPTQSLEYGQSRLLTAWEPPAEPQGTAWLTFIRASLGGSLLNLIGRHPSLLFEVLVTRTGLRIPSVHCGSSTDRPGDNRTDSVKVLQESPLLHAFTSTAFGKSLTIGTENTGTASAPVVQLANAAASGSPRQTETTWTLHRARPVTIGSQPNGQSD